MKRVLSVATTALVVVLSGCSSSSDDTANASHTGGAAGAPSGTGGSAHTGGTASTGGASSSGAVSNSGGTGAVSAGGGAPSAGRGGAGAGGTTSGGNGEVSASLGGGESYLRTSSTWRAIGGKRRFVVRNPFDAPRLVELRVESTLPKGWRWSLDQNLRIPLAARERRWVELNIDRADGEEVTRFDTPQAVVVTGLIDGRAIGGISFYLAPPSAFPRPGHGVVHRHDHDIHRDVLSLDIPWRECEFEGELELRLKFRKK